MKRLMAMVLVLMLCAGAMAESGIDWSQYSDESLKAIIDEMADTLIEAREEQDRRAFAADKARAVELKDLVTGPIYDLTGVYKSCLLDDVTINENMGTYEPGDFVALIYMTYSIKTNNDRNMIMDFSETMANGIYKACPDINDICFFWTFPEYNANGKVAYVVEDATVKLDNEMLPLAG